MIRTIKIDRDYGTKEIKYKFPKDKKLVNLFMSKEELEIIIRILKQVFNQVNFQLPNDVKAFGTATQVITANDFLYLVTGETATDTTYTGGKFLIEMWGTTS